MWLRNSRSSVSISHSTIEAANTPAGTDVTVTAATPDGTAVGTVTFATVEAAGENVADGQVAARETRPLDPWHPTGPKLPADLVSGYEFSDDDTKVALVNSGAVRLCGNFRGQTFEPCTLEAR